MELVYTVNGMQRSYDTFKDESSICSLSTRNMIAFSTTLEPSDYATRKRSKFSSLMQADARPKGQENKHNTSNSAVLEADNNVYVCDIDKPWDVHVVTCTHQQVISLHWDITSTKLLVTLTGGIIEIWNMKDKLMNQWGRIHRTVLEGEEIVCVSWLHMGSKSQFQAERKDNVMYSEKISQSEFSPSLKYFGGIPLEGWIAVTSSGQVCVGAHIANNKDLVVKTDTLSEWRSRVMLADISFNDNGDIMLAVSDGSALSVIYCFAVTLSINLASHITVKCVRTSSFFIHCHDKDTSVYNRGTFRITHLKFLSVGSSDELIVCAGTNNFSYVELWHLKEELVKIHPLFSANFGSTELHSTKKWTYRSTVTCNSLPVSIAVPRFPVVYHNADLGNRMFQYIAIAYRDGSLKLVNKADFQPMTTTNLDTDASLHDSVLGGTGKRRRVMPYVVHMQQALTGCCLVGVDQNSCLYVMKAVNTRDPVTEISPRYLVGMLEYLMIKGYDWWDVLAALKPGILEPVYRSLVDSFRKQPQIVQEMYEHNMMTICSSLYRCMPASYHKVADSHCNMILCFIVGTFDSVLSPINMDGVDRMPSERLNQALASNYNMDLDNVVLSLNPSTKDYHVDAATLQLLQPLTQWIADLCMYLLTSIHVLKASNTTYPGAELLRDGSVMSRLREMLTLTRIWRVICPSCQPQFQPLHGNIDCLSQIFKFITRIWLTVKDNPSNEIPNDLSDECCLFISQVMTTHCDSRLFGDYRSYSSSVFLQPQPVQYTFSELPSYIASSSEKKIMDGRLTCSQTTDVVRQIALNEVATQQAMRICSRCLSKSLVSSDRMDNNVQHRADWHRRWDAVCLCGGHWKSVGCIKKEV